VNGSKLMILGTRLTIYCLFLCFSLQARELLLGSSVAWTNRLDTHKDYRNTYLACFNTLVAEYEMKMYMVQPVAGEFKFSSSDSLVTFAKKNKLKVRGHALIMAANTTTPAWLFDKQWNKNDLENLLKNYIKTIVGRYKGKIYAWDVVNEALRYDGSLEQNMWYKVLGKDYLEKAYLWAHEADPRVKLFYNDYDCYERNKKSDALYAMVKDFKNRGIPIQGVGFQMHLFIDGQKRNLPDFKRVTENIKRFTDLGIEMHFTEVDVAMQPPVTPEKLKKQAHVYAELMRLCLSNKSCKAYVVWGFTDLHSWVPSYFPDYGYACLFDYDYHPKPAYDSLMSVINNWGKVPSAIKYRQILHTAVRYVINNNNYASGYRYEVRHRRSAAIVKKGTVLSDTLNISIDKTGDYIMRLWPVYGDWDTMSTARVDSFSIE
jgi:endo-1,4-beta-xylanase